MTTRKYQLGDLSLTSGSGTDNIVKEKGEMINQQEMRLGQAIVTIRSNQKVGQIVHSDGTTLVVRFKESLKLRVGGDVQVEYEVAPGETTLAAGRVLSANTKEVHLWLIHRELSEMIIREPRIPVKGVNANLVDNGSVIPVKIADVSNNGISCDIPKALELGGVYELIIKDLCMPLEVRMKVTWCHQRPFSDAMACGGLIQRDSRISASRWYSFVELRRAMM